MANSFCTDFNIKLHGKLSLFETLIARKNIDPREPVKNFVIL